ncbi:MAG: hemolysin [Flammeovirgaceae bacterium]|nr:hemolysin [Flammeovirgaceae bacterium]|tara:strand:- start:1030 stop:2298 length:1269 start_codon:yes stop_codon:yes gene_type:complete
MLDYQSQFLLIIVCILFSGLFSGLEIAYISRDKLNFEIKSTPKSFFGRVFNILNTNSSEIIAALQIGINLSLVIYGIAMADFLEPILIYYLPEIIKNDFSVLIIQTFISTLIVLVTAEYIPKSIFMINPDRLISSFSILLVFIYFIFWPVVKVVIFSLKFIIEDILKQSYSDEKPVFKITDLNEYIKKVVVSDKEIQTKNVSEFFNNALNLKAVKVRDFMIPRTEIIAVDEEDSISDLKETINKTGYTKIIIYKSSIDNVIGYCHGLSLFTNPKEINDILKPIHYVNETNLASDLLLKFISDQINIAVVIDEYGGTSGIITLEDIIEEIFGEIIDEFDELNLLEDKVDKNSFNFSARLEIDYLNDKYDLKIPEGDYDTLGGFILNFTKEIPKKNENIDYKNFTIKILSINNNRIDNVFFRKN